MASATHVHALQPPLLSLSRALPAPRPRGAVQRTASQGQSAECSANPAESKLLRLIDAVGFPGAIFPGDEEVGFRGEAGDHLGRGAR